MEHDTTLLIKMDGQHEFRKYICIAKNCQLEKLKRKIQSLFWKSFENYPSKKVTVGSKFTLELT